MAKIDLTHVEWGGPEGDWWYFYWWNWLPKKQRYFGYFQDWYDGPIGHFGFWFFNWSWMAPKLIWTSKNFGFGFGRGMGWCWGIERD